MPETDYRFDALFHPRSVAFIGASNNPNKWGSIILANLINGGFEGPIYPINPHESEIRGLKSYASVADLNETPDLAVIVIPASAIPSVIDQCVTKGIRARLVITAGFAEVGIDGKQLQREMAERARRGGMVLVGPNCNGIMRPPWKLYSTMASLFSPPGPMAVVSQSGNVGLSITRRLLRKGFGCSFYVSTGNEAYLHSEDYFGYMVDDPDTKVILSYIEGLKDGRRFFETARKITKKKPVVMLKAGGTSAGAKAAKSHTAALAGSDLAFDGACRQAGLIRANDVEELCNIGMALIRQPLPKAKRIGIITAGGGWGVLAADACSKAGLEVPALPVDTIAELDTFLPTWWSRSNPVDLVAGLRPDHMRKSLESLLRCSEIDGIMLLGLMAALPVEPVPPSASQDVVMRRTEDMISMVNKVFDEFMGLAETYQKPIIIGSEFPATVPGFENLVAPRLGEKGYICYPEPDDAAKVMASLAGYAQYVVT
jgi:acyl-CoA synthetase (NDP forming)